MKGFNNYTEREEFSIFKKFFLDHGRCKEMKKKEKDEWMKKVCVVPLSIWQCPNGVRFPVPWHRSFREQL